MNEQELRDRLHEEMAASSQPPPMDYAATYTRARGTHRRRAVLTGGGAAVAVAALAFGAAAVLSPPAAPNLPALQVDTATSVAVQPAPAPSADQLLKQLRAALPATVTVLDGPVTKAETFQYQGRTGLMATVAVTLTGGDPKNVGRVQVRLFPAIPNGSPCAVVLDVVNGGDLGDCTNQHRPGQPFGTFTLYEAKQHIGVVTGFVQPGGAVVVVLQSNHTEGNYKGLPEPPLTSDQQRALVVNPKLTAN